MDLDIDKCEVVNIGGKNEKSGYSMNSVQLHNVNETRR